jgi:hypothetical protein
MIHWHPFQVSLKREQKLSDPIASAVPLCPPTREERKRIPLEDIEITAITIVTAQMVPLMAHLPPASFISYTRLKKLRTVKIILVKVMK